MVLHQFYNGFSGYFNYPELVMALYQVNMTLFMQALYISFHKDLDWEKYG